MQSALFEDYRRANVAPPFRILPWDHALSPPYKNINYVSSAEVT